MRILLVSDIHAMSRDIEKLDGYPGPSGGILRVEDRNSRTNPILAIPTALEGDEGDIDLLLCLGDLTHQAKQLPLMAAWHDIHEISKSLIVPEVVGIIGNHDVQSRADTVLDIDTQTDFLRKIKPPFPSSDNAFNDHYFAYGVASKTIGNCLLVALDTCKTHGLGYTSETAKEIFERGTLTDGMLEKTIELINNAEVNHVVVAMHHHPIAVTDSDEEPEDEIARGTALLDALLRSDKNIIVLHGHKHYVKVQSHSRDSNSLTVFSSASLCAYPFIESDTHFSNQFHLVEFDTTVSDKAMGKILSWDWGANRWEKSSRPHMPAIVHFGETPDLVDIIRHLSRLPVTPFIESEQLLELIPQLKYVTSSNITEINLAMSVSGRRLITAASQITGMIYEEDID